MRTCRSPIFEADLKLHMYSVNESCSPSSSAFGESSKNLTDLRPIPSSVKNILHQRTPTSDDSEFNWKWLQDEPDCKCKTRLFFFGLSKLLRNVQKFYKQKSQQGMNMI